MITIKVIKITIIKKEATIRTIITFINKTLVYINQNYLIFLNAQGVVNVIIDDNNNTHNNLISEGEGIDYIKIILARTSVAFELTYINSRFDVNRVRIIREDTYIMKTSGDLISVNAIFQTFINFF